MISDLPPWRRRLGKPVHEYISSVLVNAVIAEECALEEAFPELMELKITY
jgi:hypothetical protein